MKTRQNKLLFMKFLIMKNLNVVESKTDSKERSFVWVHFDKVIYNGIRYAKCKYCR